MRKVLFVIYSIYGGGAEKQMQYLLKYIDRKKFEPHLAVFHITGKEKEVVPEDVPVYDLSTKLRPASFFLFFKLLKLIKKIKPDKILSFMWGANLIAIPVALFTGVKIVVSERTSPERDIECYSLSSSIKFLVRIFYNRVEKVISNSEFTKESLVNNFRISSDKIIVIKNGINIDKVERETIEGNAEIPEEDFVISVGHLEKVKNYEFLIDVIAEINGKYKIKIPLVILGEGSMRKELEREAEKLGVELIMPGHIDNPYVWMKKAKVFCLTSLYEGFPNVILEAFVCGVPVVAVDCPGGIREIIKDGENGIIIPQGNKEMFIKELKELLESNGLREKLVRNAKESVKKFDIKKIVKEYENVLLQ